MSDDTALSILPTPGSPMSTTTRRSAPKGNASPKRSKPRHRNAGAAGPVSRSVATKNKEPPPLTTKEKLVHLAETLGGAGLTSVLGAYAVKWGLHPELVSTGLGIAGGYFALSPHSARRFAGAGAASAAGSQLLLMQLNPPPAPPPPVHPAPAPPPLVAQVPHLKNADLGTLPQGALDAAFERARAELAVAGDGYPPDYEYDHHFHHGPVRP